MIDENNQELITSDKGKIFVINNLPPPSAIYRYSHDLTDALSGKSKLVNIIYDKSKWLTNPDGHCYTGKFGNHYIINATLNNFSFKSLRILLLNHIKAGGFVHYAHESSRPFKLPNSKCVATIHENPEIRLNTDLYSNQKNGFAENLNKGFRKKLYNEYKRFENILTVSESVKKGLIDFGFSGKIKVVYPPVSHEFKPLQNKIALRKKLNLPLNKKLILSVSTNTKRKNLQMVREVMQYIGNDFQLVRIGESIGNDYFFNNVDGKTLNEIYNACDLLLFPTLAEGYGYPLVEALSVGLPVVASNIEVIRETAGNAAILVDHDSKDNFIKGINEALSASDELIKLGYERSDRYSFTNFKKNIVQYYGNLGVK